MTSPTENDKEGKVLVKIGERASKCSGECRVLFKQEFTDTIEEIVSDPKDKTRLMIYGQFKNGIDEIKVGDYMCTVEPKE